MPAVRLHFWLANAASPSPAYCLYYTARNYIRPRSSSFAFTGFSFLSMYQLSSAPHSELYIHHELHTKVHKLAMTALPKPFILNTVPPASKVLSLRFCSLRESPSSSSSYLLCPPQERKLLAPCRNFGVLRAPEENSEKVTGAVSSCYSVEPSFADESANGKGCSEGEATAGALSPLSVEDARHTGARKLSNIDAIGSKVKNRSERRRKSTVFEQNVMNMTELPDLLTVPGIGPRNLEKLVAKGIGKVAELKQLYRDKFLNGESTKMVEYLQSSVGIVHKNHAESITTYVKHSVDEELKEQLLSQEKTIRQNKKVTICVEGNISVGKTTFLQKVVSDIIELRDMVEIVPEPVDQWKDVGPEHFNLLNAFYNEPERYAYTFQNYVFATRLMKEQETSKGMKPIRLMERSIFSDRLVFVRAVHEAKWMSELELRIYESWFDPFISALPGLVPDGFIYLRASPDTCLRRLHMRNRPEERSVTLEYLKGLHEKHEQCFFPSGKSGGIYSVSRWPAGSHKLPPPPKIRDRVFYLEGEHLHSSIQKIPAFILDCEASIDFNRDTEARAEYAQEVAEFYKYIRSNKDLDTKEKAQCETVNSSLLPFTGGLVGPDGTPLLHAHQLDALNLRLAPFATS